MLKYLLATAALTVAFAHSAVALQRMPYTEIKVDVATPVGPVNVVPG